MLHPWSANQERSLSDPRPVDPGENEGKPVFRLRRSHEGLGLFLGKGQCALCHAPPFFSSAMGGAQATYFNVGIGTDKPEPDAGRFGTTKNDADWGAFKVPSLRNVAKSAPYFHDGSVATLDEAVRLMAKGGVPNKNLSPLMKDRGLGDDEVRSVVAFLGALDCNKKLEQPALP